MTDVQDALEELIAQEPGLSPILAGHLEDNDGELLSTIFVAEVIDWVVRHRSKDPEVATRVFTWMNDRYEGASDELKDVIATGGVEAIPIPSEPGSELRNLLSPALHAVDPWNKTWMRLRAPSSNT